MARPYTIYAVQTVDEAVELLTGVPAGEAEAGGDYPEGTMNARVVARLPGNLLKLLLEELHRPLLLVRSRRYSATRRGSRAGIMNLDPVHDACIDRGYFLLLYDHNLPAHPGMYGAEVAKRSRLVERPARAGVGTHYGGE